MPLKLTDAKFKRICKALSLSSKGVKFLCKKHNISAVSFYNSLHNNPDRLTIYTRAREMQADFLADQIIAIADKGHRDVMRIKELKNADGSKTYVAEENAEFTNRSKLRIEARKWIASKLKPKKYGDNSQVEVTVKKLGKDIPEEYV